VGGFSIVIRAREGVTVPVFQVLRDRLHFVLPALGVCLLAWAGYAIWRDSTAAQSELRLTCSAGGQGTRRHQLLSIFANHVSASGLEMQFVESAGSEEILDLIETGKLDIGLISGGFRSKNHVNVRQLASIGREPLHLLVKSELCTGSTNDLELLRNRRVSVGVPGSGGFALATEVLAFAELKPASAQEKGDYTQLQISNDELIARCREIRMAKPEQRATLIADLPDAVFVLMPVPSITVKELVAAANFELIPLPFAESFRANGSQHVGAAHHSIDRRRVNSTTVPAFTYRVLPGLPATDCETLGVSTIFVAREGLPAEIVNRLTAELSSGPFADELPSADIATIVAEYPLHPAVMSYLEHQKPLLVKDMVELSQKMLSLFGAFSAGVFGVYGYYRRRRGKSAESYLEEIGKIERISWGQTEVEPSDLDERERFTRLENQLVQLKQRIIQDHTVGRLVGDAAFANLMSLITDTRQSLNQAGTNSRSQPDLKFIPRQQASQIDSQPKRIRFGT